MDDFAPAGATGMNGPTQILRLDVVIGLERPGVRRREFHMGDMPIMSWDRPSDVERRFAELLEEIKRDFRNLL